MSCNLCLWKFKRLPWQDMMEFPLRGFELMNLVVRCCNIFTDTLNTNVIIGKASLFFLPILVIRRVISWPKSHGIWMLFVIFRIIILKKFIIIINWNLIMLYKPKCPFWCLKKEHLARLGEGENYLMDWFGCIFIIGTMSLSCEADWFDWRIDLYSRRGGFNYATCWQHIDNILTGVARLESAR